MKHDSAPTPSGRPTIELLRYPGALPTFILGSVRSGTSAVMHALRHGASMRGYNEGALAQLLPVLLQVMGQHYDAHTKRPRTMLASVSREFMEIGLKNLFATAFIEIMGEGRWLDKTPGAANMVRACPHLLEIFPNATFIFCKRRGVENVLSRQRKYPGWAFEAHCDAWAKTMEAWLEVRPHLGERCIEIDQREMALRPAQVAKSVAGLLGLSTGERDGFLRVLQSDRPEQTRAARDESFINISETGWSEEEQETFRRICGSMMQAFGYGTGEDASASPQPKYLFFVPVVDAEASRENIGTKNGCRTLDATSFAIYPNHHDQLPAGIRYRAKELSRFRRFSADLSVAGAESEKVEGLIFAFRLEGSRDGTTGFAAERAVRSGDSASWELELPELPGEFHVVLSVRPMSGGQASDVCGVWTRAQLC